MRPLTLLLLVSVGQSALSAAAASTVGQSALSAAAASAIVGCSLIVDENIDDVRCASEGTIGPPACDVGEICADGRCRDCLATDVCGDGVDNDCSGGVDEGCSVGGAGGSG